MPNVFNVLKYKDTNIDTLQTISTGVSTARFSLNVANTESAFIQIDLAELEANTSMIMELSATPSWADGIKVVHFAIKDPDTNTLSKRQEVFGNITPDDGYLIPITYTRSIEKIIIDIEIIGANQNTVLNIGAGINSNQ